jgi:hypothetical protein
MVVPHDTTAAANTTAALFPNCMNVSFPKMGDLKFDEADKNSVARLFGNMRYSFPVSRHGSAGSAYI